MSLNTIAGSVKLSREFFLSLGVPGLFAVAFLEFFLLPVPPDLVLIPLTAARPELALFYAMIATMGSVTAGSVGYLIGRWGGRTALKSRFSDARITQVEDYIDRYGTATLAFGAFAPIPEGYELLSVATGAFGLKLRSYLLASVAGRGGRYFLEAMLVLTIGEAAKSFTEVEVYSIVGVASLIVAIGYLMRHRWIPNQWLVVTK